MESMVRAHLIVSGRVQGVFFRDETRRAANRLGVGGWVRNKADGSVEAVVEGPHADVAALIEWCRQGSPMARVDRVDITWETHQGAFDRFDVRF